MLEFLASIAATSQNASQNTPVVPGILNVLISGLICGCLTCWIWAAVRLSRGKPLIPWHSRESVPWNLLDAFVAIILQFLFIFAGANVFALTEHLDFTTLESKSLSAPQQMSLMVFGEVSMLIATGLTIAYLMFRSRATTIDLGLSTANLKRDVLAGVLAFFMLMMPVLLMQVGLEKLFPSAGNHPFVDLLREKGDDAMLGLIFVMAVIIAPIVEEFLFRVVIQGWLERLVASQRSPDREVLAAVQDFDVVADVIHEGGPSDGTSDHADEPTAEDSPYSPPIEPRKFANLHPLASRERIAQAAPADALRIWGPIVFASALFAGAHFGHGTAPVPLFFLSLGLGYVYHRTHRIWPSLVTHGLVNLLAVVQLKIAMDNGIPV